jgi:hypothetical protein
MMLANTEETDQAEFIESAIDNLIFNQSVQFYGVMDFPQSEEDIEAFIDDEDGVFDFDSDYNDEDYYD